MEPTDVAKRFERHYRDADNDRDDLNEVRDRIQIAAEAVNDAAPDGREKSTALTKLEEAHQWAERAILNADG